MLFAGVPAVCLALSKHLRMAAWITAKAKRNNITQLKNQRIFISSMSQVDLPGSGKAELLRKFEQER